MKGELKIRNFGPIKEADLDLRQTTVFIGPQASGKSTIAKLILIGKKIAEDISYGLSFNSEENDYSEKLENYFPNSFFNIESTDIKYDDFSKPNAFSYGFKGHFVINGRKRIKVFGGQTEKRRNILFIPAERTFISIASGAFINLINNKVPIPKIVLEFGAAFEKARSQEQYIHIDFLGISYFYLDGEDKIQLPNFDLISLKESSSGQQNVVPMLLCIENNYQIDKGGTSFIVEEPELNLYPAAQKQLTYHLVNRCTRENFKNQLFNNLVLTTHSPYILTALNNLLFAYKVAKRHPEKEAEIQKIIPKESWINPEDFNAYFVANGTVEQIFNRTTGMISENELDSGSDEILEDFDALMEIYKLPAHA